MKDLDFDELDRAVNSLLTNNDAPAADDTPPLPVNDTVVPVDEVVPQPQPTATQPLAARRSSGRFMDVVHPSSDMRASMPVRPVSREGLGIAPSAPSTSPVEQTTPWSSPVVPEAPVEVETPRPTAGEWPDPLDFNGFKSDGDQKPSVELLPPEQSSDDQSQPVVDEDKDINQIADAINKPTGST
jgi:hypothetical protein